MLIKAGVIPFVIENGIPKMMFMVSSNPLYGGDKPMIAKGFINHSESYFQAAIREGSEELGLLESNIKRILPYACGIVTGLQSKYKLITYPIQVYNKHAFDKPHHETKETVWMTYSEFLQYGRENQYVVISLCDDIIRCVRM